MLPSYSHRCTLTSIVSNEIADVVTYRPVTNDWLHAILDAGKRSSVREVTAVTQGQYIYVQRHSSVQVGRKSFHEYLT